MQVFASHTLSSPPHNFVEVPAVPGTCASEGSEAGFQCSVCHKLFDKDYKEVDKLPSSGFDSNNHNYQASWKWDDEEFVLDSDFTKIVRVDDRDDDPTVVLTVTCANGCGDTITRTATYKEVVDSLVTANCVLGRNAEEDLTAELVIDDVKYTDTHHIVVPFKHKVVWHYRNANADGTYTADVIGSSYANSNNQHRAYCSRCGEWVSSWESHQLVSFTMVGANKQDTSFVAKCDCEKSATATNLYDALSKAGQLNSGISRVIVDKKYPETGRSSAGYATVAKDVTLVIEVPLTITDGSSYPILVEKGGHLDVNTVVGENVIVKDENTKTVTARVDNTTALGKALAEVTIADPEEAEGWVANITVDEKTAGEAIAISSAVTVSEGVTLNLTAGDLAKGSKSEYVKLDNSSNVFKNNGTLNVTGVELTRGIETGSVDDKEETTAVLNVVNSKIDASAVALVVNEGTVNVTDSVVNAPVASNAINVQNTGAAKVVITNSTLGSVNAKTKAVEKSGNISVKKENAEVTVSGSSLVGTVDVDSVSKGTAVTLSNTDVTGNINVSAVGTKLGVTGGSIKSESDSAVVVKAETKVAEDAVDVSLNGVDVESSKDKVALGFISAGTYSVTGSKVLGGSGIQALNGTVDVKSTSIEAIATSTTNTYADPASGPINDGCAITLISAKTAKIGNDEFPALTLNVDSASKLTVAQNGGEKIKVYVLNVGGPADIAVNATGYEINKNHDISIVDSSNLLATKHKDPVAEVVLTINGEVYEAE